MKLTHSRPCPVDMISNLPDEILDIILMRLTIRDAAKTSILSKQWRYKWVKLPQLIFDEGLWHGLAQHAELARIKFLVILFRVLLLHRGPIAGFSLINRKLDASSEIDIIFTFLLFSGVEEFTFGLNEDYELPFSFFMFSQLKHLNLSFCVIEPPPNFKGFNRLTRLELRHVDIYGEALERLISSCPLLEQLVLSVCNCDSFNIDAPMLKLFDLVSTEKFVLRNALFWQ